VHVPQPEHHCDSVLTIRNRVGVGLAGMRERMNELNGKLEIESGGHGTMGIGTVRHRTGQFDFSSCTVRSIGFTVQRANK
jgi:signal transduction histidine kinase